MFCFQMITQSMATPRTETLEEFTFIAAVITMRLSQTLAMTIPRMIYITVGVTTFSSTTATAPQAEYKLKSKEPTFPFSKRY